MKTIKKVVRKDEKKPVKKAVPAKSTAKPKEVSKPKTVRREIHLSANGDKILIALAEKRNCTVQTLIMEAIKLRYKVQ
jgi:hypothetical protein